MRYVRKTYVNSCHTYILWLEKFVVGIHKRMRDVMRQDKSIALSMVHKTNEKVRRRIYEWK